MLLRILINILFLFYLGKIGGKIEDLEKNIKTKKSRTSKLMPDKKDQLESEESDPESKIQTKRNLIQNRIKNKRRLKFYGIILTCLINAAMSLDTINVA